MILTACAHSGLYMVGAGGRGRGVDLGSRKLLASWEAPSKEPLAVATAASAVTVEGYQLNVSNFQGHRFR